MKYYLRWDHYVEEFIYRIDLERTLWNLIELGYDDFNIGVIE